MIYLSNYMSLDGTGRRVVDGHGSSYTLACI